MGSLVFSTGCGNEKKPIKLKDETLPNNLKSLLENKNVLKVGVNVHGDTCRIANTFNCNVLSAYNLMNKTESGIKRASTSGGKSEKAAKGGGSLEKMSLTHCPAHMQLDKKSDGSKVSKQYFELFLCFWNIYIFSILGYVF